MGVFDKFLDIMKLNDEDDYEDDFYDEDEYFDDEESYKEKPQRRSLFGRKIRKKTILMISIWRKRKNSSLLQAIK